ncbi:MAG: hypothetical protein D084_Lepto4C00232G0002 [Leptospirillum sp. Group IV 'UBA BS']|nr:MAG: hypothetical protein D084_Lepto4C00232G0002 [Leptospirillum sp. Group IV 'UBA BS']
MDPGVLMALIGQCSAASAPPALVYAVSKAESGGHPFIVRDNTTGRVHLFPSYSAALSFINAYPRHSLDIGLMQINTKAHKVRPEEVLSPCENIREGSEILSRDMSRSGQDLRKTLCLYHRGKVNCGSYPEKVAAFLSRLPKRNQLVAGLPEKRSSGIRGTSTGEHPEKENPVLDLADTTPEGDNSGEDPEKELDPQFRAADIDEFMGNNKSNPLQAR